MNNVNYEVLHRFIEGLRYDIDKHGRTENSYYNGVNGRLYSHHGVVSFSSIKGTTKVYEDPDIIKILGYWPFDDELILIVKYKKSENFNNFLSDSNFENRYNEPFSCVDGGGSEINYSEYYTEVLNGSDVKQCALVESDNFENNKDYLDAFISITKDDLNNFIGKVIWKGLLNFPYNGKICTYGIHENSFYKRIYFTDYLNPFRVINLKDPNLSLREFKEFQTLQSTSLLSPIIESILPGGMLKAGTTIYTYRLITDNGQVTEFSPLSDAVKIVKDDTSGTSYKGGDVSDVTSKRVIVKCNIQDWKNFKEIECVAIEYQALGAPTSIRTLGIKPTAAYVLFDHYGTESEFSNTITLSEILERKNTWKYCSDISSKKNKLIVSGLRNDPTSNSLLNLQKDFSLHSWDEFGETHNCLMNPKPWKYRFIDPSNKDSMYFIKEKMYDYIKTFGNVVVKLVNQNNDSYYENSFSGLKNDSYYDITEKIFNWLNEIKNNADFLTKFPNLKFEFISNRLYFKPINEALNTDISDYIFEYNHSQIIEELQEDISFQNITIDTSKLIYGAQSLGFNKGNGIRITYKTELSPVLDKATKSYDRTEDLLKLRIPDTKKSFFKGEIYRIGFQIYDNNGFQLFNLPIGDIKIPEIGEQKKYINENGDIVITSEYYVNSRVIDNVMYAEKIILKAEVRLSCKIQKMISMYQLTYVERNYENRTIVCQGISAPMERCNVFFHKEHISLPDEVANKWNLPFYGGPTYDWFGLQRYDQDPNHNDEWDRYWRINTNRSLFYFDSPDVIYNRIPADFIKNGFVQRIARLNPDNNKLSWRKIRASRDSLVYVNETFPSFSRRIDFGSIEAHDDRKSLFVNMSVFLERAGLKNTIKIQKSEELKYGEIIPGTALNQSHEISNNAMTLPYQSWYYSYNVRQSEECNVENGAKYEAFGSSAVSPGYKTVIIKTDEDVFTNEFIDENYTEINAEFKNSVNDDGRYYSTHALINIKMNNEESIYGGRSESAYSRNVYIPLSKTIPTLKTSDNAQTFDVYGDTYTTLYARHKNGYRNNDADLLYIYMNNFSNCSRTDYEEHEPHRNGAWNYAFLVECSFEPKWNHNDVFYRNKNFDFQKIYNESVNEAYYQENTLRSFIPKPHGFKDDPDMNNIVAVSDTKANGDYFDAWTSFRVNNFYELEKDKGTIYNLAKFLDEIYAIQEHQTSLLIIDQNTMMNTSNGEISVKQGDGSPISDHKIISDYGTSIRRAIVEKVQNMKDNGGFAFIDERKYEWVNISEPLLFGRNLHLKFQEIFEGDKIIDTEGYYDDEYKETNIRIRTKLGKNFVLSFNDGFEVFNGYIEYDNDIYMIWDNKVFAPKLSVLSEIHQLNTGVFLNFFDNQKTMKLGVTVNINPTSVKIFKSWAGIINIKYPIKKMEIKTNLGQTRTILGEHYRYKIREGRHSVFMKNRNDWDDLRGEFATVEIELESKDNQKVDVFSFINFIRHSFQ